LPLGEPGQVGLELPLPAVEVGRPGHEPPLETLLYGGDRLRELHAGTLGLALDDAPALLGQPPLLLAQLVAGVGALARQQPLELQHPLANFRLYEGGQVLASGFAEPLDVARASKPPCEGHQAELGDGGRSQSARRQQQRIVVGEAIEHVDRQSPGGREGGEGKHDRQ
jgi:hypothetical protein